MAAPFSPIENLEIFCRFCEKITSVQLDRSIAENGRIVDRNSTFEYLCSKCFKTVCFTGTDLLEMPKPEDGERVVRIYSPKEHYLIGEQIQHKKWKDSGIVVSKDNSVPSKILVNFNKLGLKKLIQDLE